MDSAERYSCVAAGKARHPSKIQTSISYEHLDRDAILSSRQEAATHRSHHTRSTSLPKIATGRSVHSAKKLWQDYETIEVKAKVQRENEKTPEVSPLRVPKNPHSLYKHTVRNVKPYHILHSPSDYGRANHQLRQLYAQVTYLSNAVRNCDGTASYRGMCKSRQSYRGNGDNPLRLHWSSSNDKKPVPRLLLPVMPGTNTKWYSWKVDTPREEGSPRGGGGVRGSDKRYASSAPVSRSLDFMERYRKKHRVVFSVDDDGGRRSKNSKETDSKSKDGHLSVKSIGATESLASSSLSSILKYDANKFKLSDTESVAGTAVFLTQTETGKVSPEVQRKEGDVATGSQDGNEETKEPEEAATDQEENKTSDGENFSGAKEEAVVQNEAIQTEAIKEAPESSPEDELDIVARANEVADTRRGQVSDEPQQASNADEPRQASNADEPQQTSNKDEPLQASNADEPQQASNENEPLQASNADEPQQASNEDKPLQASNADEPQQASNADEPLQASNGDEPLQASNADEPQQASNADEPRQASNADKPQQASNADEPQQASNAVTDTTTSHDPQQGTSVSQQQDIDMATNVQSDAPIAKDQPKVVDVTSDKEEMLQSQDGDPITVDSGTGNPENDSFDNQQTVQSNDDNLVSTPANQENTAIPRNSDNEQYTTPNSGNGNSEGEQHPSEDSNLLVDDQPPGVQVPHTEDSLDAHEVDEAHEEKQVNEANEHTQEADITYTSQDT